MTETNAPDIIKASTAFANAMRTIADAFDAITELERTDFASMSPSKANAGKWAARDVRKYLLRFVCAAHPAVGVRDSYDLASACLRRGVTCRGVMGFQMPDLISYAKGKGGGDDLSADDRKVADEMRSIVDSRGGVTRMLRQVRMRARGWSAAA